MDRVPVYVQDLLTAFKTKVYNDRVFYESGWIVLTLTDEPDALTARPPADRFLSLFPVNCDSEAGLQAGGGRVALTFDGMLKASLWLRIPGDVFGSDEDALLNPTKGVLLQFAQVISSLEQFDPDDGAGHLMLSEPLRILRWYPVPRKSGDPFGRLVAEFRLIYQQALPVLPLAVPFPTPI